MVILCRMRRLIKQIPSMLWDIDIAETSATNITSVLTGMPKAKSNQSKVENSAIKIAALKDAYAEVIDELNAMKEELQPLIDTLDNADDRAAMRLRYINGYKPEDIANSRFRTARSIYYYLNRAEDTLVRKYPDKVMR